MQKQKTPILRSKFGKPLGFNAPVPVKDAAPNSKQNVGFDPARFKTQHKG